MTPEQIFGEWLVMTKQHILEWDVLIADLKKTQTEENKTLSIWVTSTRKQETE